MKLVYFGSGEFGVPTLQRLSGGHDIALVVTQPDRPAGRHRTLTPTPVAAFAQERNLVTIKPENVNDPAIVQQIQDCDADAFVVIAFGQKMGDALLRDVFAINLHGSLLPRYRGAAPIQWALINGERETGVSVIAVAERMDAGEIYAQAATTIDLMETAGELHDRLALLGPDLVTETLRRHEDGCLIPQQQDPRHVTHARKLTKADGTVRFDQSAVAVRSRVHGLTPWPGCTVRIDGGGLLRLLRVRVVGEIAPQAIPGTVLENDAVACAQGVVQLLEVQPPGGKRMSFEAYRCGHGVRPGLRMESL